MDTTAFKLPNISKKWIIRIGVIVSVLILVLGTFGWINGLQKAGVQREVTLSRSYESLKTGLDAFLSTAREQAGVTQAQSASFDKIMLDAVQGRYQSNGEPTAAQPGTGSLFSAIQEAYPNLDTLNSSYSRILDTISSGRTAFANNQNKLQDQLREFDQWRKSGIIHSFVVASVMGIPNDNLVTVNGNDRKTGTAAYNVMTHVITSNLTQGAFKSGDLEAQDFFSGK